MLQVNPKPRQSQITAVPVLITQLRRGTPLRTVTSHITGIKKRWRPWDGRGKENPQVQQQGNKQERLTETEHDLAFLGLTAKYVI